MERYFSHKEYAFLNIETLHVEDADYGYATGRLAILEKSILDKNAFKKLIYSDNVGEILKLLESPLSSIYNLIYELAPRKEIFDIFFLQYSFHNLKVRLKEKFAGRKTDTPLFAVGPVLMEATSPVLREAIVKIEQKFYKDGRFQHVDSILDEEYFSFLLRIAAKYKIPLIESLVKTWIDLANIKLFFRFKVLQKDKNSLSGFLFTGGNFEKSFYVNTYDLSLDVLKRETKNNFYAKLFLTGIKCLEDEKSMEELEVKCDRFVLERFSETKYIVYGIEPMVRYFLYKENEMKMLRMVLVGKENNIPKNEIEERIAGYYV